MARENLFRREAIENKQYSQYGTVLINTPLLYQLIIPIFISIIICIFLFLYFAEFTEKFIVIGYVNSSKGVVRVFPNKSGVILKSLVKQGMRIKKGDLLFLIDTSDDGVYRNQQNELLKQIEKRKTSLVKEIIYKQQQLEALKGILAKKYISQVEFNLKREEIINLQNNKSLLEIELIRYKKDRVYKVRSPISGTVSTVIYKQGQYIIRSKQLIKILPDNSSLIAEIYIPANQAGFLNMEDKIRIRYDAYPYEYFGSYGAQIKEISQSILTDAEEEKPINIGMPYYKVIAALEQPFVMVYGHSKKIQDGMTFSAIINGKKRKAWEWIFRPIITSRGELFS